MSKVAPLRPAAPAHPIVSTHEQGDTAKDPAAKIIQQLQHLLQVMLLMLMLMLMLMLTADC
jgi:hypothetical protein